MGMSGHQYALLRNQNAFVEQRSKGMQSAINTWLRRVARYVARDSAPTVHALAKRFADEHGDIERDLIEILTRYGLRTITDSANESAGETILTPTIVSDAMRNKDVRIKWYYEWRKQCEQRALKITSESMTEAQEYVRDIISTGLQEHPHPSAGELARRIRNTLYSGPEPEAGQRRPDQGRVFTFSSERAALIARTEIGQAQAVGWVAGVAQTSTDPDSDEVEWLAYRDGGRDHDKMQGKRITVSDMLSDDPSRWFEMPDGARMRYPHDPAAPIRHTANCRCGTRKISHRVR